MPLPILSCSCTIIITFDLHRDIIYCIGCTGISMGQEKNSPYRVGRVIHEYYINRRLQRLFFTGLHKVG